MNITQSRLMEMIAEELGSALRERSSDRDDNRSKGKGEPKRPETASADGVGRDLGGNPDGAKAGGRRKDAMPVGSDPLTVDTDVDGMDDADPGPIDPEQGDDAEEDEADAIDAEGDADEEPTGKVNDELSGKTVQAISIEPKSKVLPGAKEVLISFNETTDVLRILVTGTGAVKFFYRNQIHDLP